MIVSIESNGCVKACSTKIVVDLLCQFPDGRVLGIQLLGKSDLTIDDNFKTPQERFDYYLASYTLSSPTEGVGQEVKAPLLRRCVHL
jgi:histone deacetylase complex regulatory component SIN3